MPVSGGALGLDQPIFIQYAKWFGQLLRGNLGYSFHTGQPVGVRIFLNASAPHSRSVGGDGPDARLAIPLGVAPPAAPTGGAIGSQAFWAWWDFRHLLSS